MVSPTGGRYPPPRLSPQERVALTAADRNAIDAWQHRLNGYPPGADDFARLYLQGKRAARAGSSQEGGA